MYSEWRIDRMSRLKRALALRSVLNGFRAGRHSWIVVSVIESGVLAGMPSRQRSGGGVRRGVTGSASISAAASARASGTVPTVSAFVFQESGRSHARAYRWHRQLQSVVPGRARFRVSKRRFTAIVVVVVVVVAAAPVRRSLRNEISVGEVDATRSFDRETQKTRSLTFARFPTIARLRVVCIFSHRGHFCAYRYRLDTRDAKATAIDITASIHNRCNSPADRQRSFLCSFFLLFSRLEGRDHRLLTS